LKQQQLADFAGRAGATLVDDKQVGGERTEVAKSVQTEEQNKRQSRRQHATLRVEQIAFKARKSLHVFTMATKARA
jgi:hypothetical protein